MTATWIRCATAIGRASVFSGMLALCALPVQAQSDESTSASAPATPDNPNDATERARLHFKNGVDLYREHNFRAALIEFKRAYKASPHYKLLYNLGQASLELQEDSSAIDYFTNYLNEGGDELDPDRRREVKQTIARLQARLATATITVNQTGAEVYVDDSLVGTSPLADGIKVSVGRRRFSAIKRGFPVAEQTIDVAAGDHVTVGLEMKDRAPDLAKLQHDMAVRDEAKRGPTVSTAGWMGIVTGALGAGAITLTILTALAQKDYDNERKHVTTAAQLENVRDDAKVKALATDITWGATIAAGAITTILLVTDKHEQSPSEKNGNGIKVDLGVGSLRLRGQF
jgi:hypothetical protein